MQNNKSLKQKNSQLKQFKGSLDKIATKIYMEFK